MRSALRLLVAACLLAAPLPAWAESLDAVDVGTSESPDDVEQGRSLPPDEMPEEGAETPDVVGPGAEITNDGESLDAVDTGRSETPGAPSE